MPDLSRAPAPAQATSQTTTQTAPQTAGQSVGRDNTFLADLLAGRTRLDGRAEDWFAKGVRFQRGMKGDLIKQVQSAIGAQADGAFGPKSEALLKQFQKARGLQETGAVDRGTWDRIVAAGPALNGEADFGRMWANHPHNYMQDASQNTSSADLTAELGLKATDAPNTCALRMSTMFNRMGGGHELSQDKGRAAGLDKMRSTGLYMPKVNDPKAPKAAQAGAQAGSQAGSQAGAQDTRVILSAKEMWTYLEHKRGRPDLVWPPRNGERYKTAEEAQQAVGEIKAAVSGKKGFIAFDKIFGYGGSGHVDLFDGQQLSDGEFYPAQRTMIWLVVK